MYLYKVVPIYSSIYILGHMIAYDTMYGFVVANMIVIIKILCKIVFLKNFSLI